MALSPGHSSLVDCISSPAALCIKHGIPVEAERSNLALFSHLRELRDRIKTLALLEVPPESLSLQAPSHSQELLISLQARCIHAHSVFA